MVCLLVTVYRQTSTIKVEINKSFPEKLRYELNNLFTPLFVFYAAVEQLHIR